MKSKNIKKMLKDTSYDYIIRKEENSYEIKFF